MRCLITLASDNQVDNYLMEKMAFVNNHPKKYTEITQIMT